MKNLFNTYPGFLAMASFVFSFLIITSCSDDDDNAAGQITLDAATVTTYNPDNGKEGAGVIISGTNFSKIPSENKIWFNGIEAIVRSSSSTTLLTTVPVGATDGAVTVSVKGAEQVEGVDFNVLLPTIITVTPLEGGIGETVVITGTNFNTTANKNKVLFNGIEAVVTESSATSLTTTVPTGATSGTVSVQVEEGSIIDGPSFTVTNIVTFSVALSDPDDDVEEAAGDFGETAAGFMDLGSSDLEMGEIDSEYGPEIIGVRFRGVNIPKGATIKSASIVFMADDTGSGPVNLRIHGENIGDSPVNTEALFNTSSRPKTTASTLWTVAPWLAVGDKGEAQTTVNLAEIVQEIVNRTDWNANNSMNFIFTQEGENSSTTSDGRESETFGGEGQEEEAPIFTVEYEVL